MTQIKNKTFVYGGGGLFIFIGLFICLYVGIDCCLYHGVIDIINGFNFKPWNASKIALGIIKVLCTGVVNLIGIFIFIIPGWAATIEGVK